MESPARHDIYLKSVFFLNNKNKSCRYAYDARQYRPCPRTYDFSRLFLRRSLWGMLPVSRRTDGVMGLSNIDADFSAIDTMRLRTCMFAPQSCRALTALRDVMVVQPSTCLHLKYALLSSCPKA